MHEASLMQSLLRRIDAAAAAEGANRVVAVTVRLGALSHFSPGHFRDHFRSAATGTTAAGARLTVTVDTDTADPRAGEVTLESIDVEE